MLICGGLARHSIAFRHLIKTIIESSSKQIKEEVRKEDYIYIYVNP